MNGDEQKTEYYTSMNFQGPVDALYDLPKKAEEGESRYVREESAVYTYRQGGWIKQIYKPR